MADCTRVGMPRFSSALLHGQGVHHGGQHADVVGLGALHAGGGAGDAAEDVAAADHHADLDAHGDDVADIGGDGADRLVVQAILAPAHQGFAGEFQQDALVERLWGHAARLPGDAGRTLVGGRGGNKVGLATTGSWTYTAIAVNTAHLRVWHRRKAR